MNICFKIGVGIIIKIVNILTLLLQIADFQQKLYILSNFIYTWETTFDVNMSTISSFTKDIVNKDLLLKEALLLGIASHSKLAEYIKPQIEKKTGQQVNIHTIIMALHRYEKRLKNNEHIQHLSYFDEINVKTDLTYLLINSLSQSAETIIDFLHKLESKEQDKYHFFNNDSGIGIIASNLFMKKLIQQLEEKDIEEIYVNLVMITLRYSKTSRNTAEILHNIFFQLAKENIDIVTWIDKPDEIVIFISEKGVTRAYDSLHKFKKTITITPSKNKKDKIRIISSDEEE